MLSPEEKHEIDEELKHLPYKESAAIDALKIVQNHRGWVTDEALDDVGEYLDMSPDALDSIATFYNLIFRKPVGEHVIRICDSVSCYLTGYENLRDAITKKLGIKLGGTTEDNKFTFLPIQCLGTCDHAPAMMIDDELYRDLTPEKLDEIFAQYK
ncbi:MAG: NADH-quinone oxidoreductase subunit E [Candidatus Marinimicrobia bacterium]|nr:NADH-quinone oxidoreductase subunit E [Candidatus Neomarinimicrobiota bacterium]